MNKQIIIDGVDVSECEFYSYIESNKYPHRCTCYEDMYGASAVCDLADGCKNCRYKQLKAKEQECKALREEKAYTDIACEQLQNQLKRKEQECKNWQKELDKTHLLMLEKQDALIKSMQECERLSKGYAELTDIVAPYMDDFTGYNEQLGGFDLILCVKELLERLDKPKQCQTTTDNIEELYELAKFERAMSVGSPIALYPFTPEKQLELIKWLSYTFLGHFHCYTVSHRFSDNFGNYCVGIGRCETYHKHFDQALSGLVIQLWNDLTDKQKEEIKEILQ